MAEERVVRLHQLLKGPVAPRAGVPIREEPRLPLTIIRHDSWIKQEDRAVLLQADLKRRLQVCTAKGRAHLFVPIHQVFIVGHGMQRRADRRGLAHQRTDGVVAV